MAEDNTSDSIKLERIQSELDAVKKAAVKKQGVEYPDRKSDEQKRKETYEQGERYVALFLENLNKNAKKSAAGQDTDYRVIR